jgi:hypothetical protein
MPQCPQGPQSYGPNLAAKFQHLPDISRLGLLDMFLLYPHLCTVVNVNHAHKLQVELPICASPVPKRKHGNRLSIFRPHVALPQRTFLVQQSLNIPHRNNNNILKCHFSCTIATPALYAETTPKGLSSQKFTAA